MIKFKSSMVVLILLILAFLSTQEAFSGYSAINAMLPTNITITPKPSIFNTKYVTKVDIQVENTFDEISAVRIVFAHSGSLFQIGELVDSCPPNRVIKVGQTCHFTVNVLGTIEASAGKLLVALTAMNSKGIPVNYNFEQNYVVT